MWLVSGESWNGIQLIMNIIDVLCIKYWISDCLSIVSEIESSSYLISPKYLLFNHVKAAKSSICRSRPNPVNCCVELTPDSQRWMVGDLDSMNNANKISTFVVSRPTVTHTLVPGAHTRFGLRKKCISTQFLACITWNSNQLQVTALWLLHLLSGFLVSNVEKLKRYFLVYCPELRVGSSEHKPRPRSVSGCPCHPPASGGLSPGWRSPGDCPRLTSATHRNWGHPQQ